MLEIESNLVYYCKRSLVFMEFVKYQVYRNLSA